MTVATTFARSLPFGAEPLGETGVRFRAWAPGVDALSVALTDDDRMLPMTPASSGWFELTTAEAAPGTAYMLALPDGLRVPDPASRAQRDDVHGPSLVVDPRAYAWRHGDWAGRPWRETVLYELHVGTFTPEGTFAALEQRLEEIAGLGVTAIELMPVADFPGRRNWGYDGVLPFAPDRAYGTPEQLKSLIDAAHGIGLMVFVDVVYNHFGPDGNYLHAYAPSFFTDRYATPWGAAIDFSVPEVRSFFIENALYWLEEYRLDGLRLDAVHAIRDEGPKHFLDELAERVDATIGRDRHVHLVLENDDNAARFLGPRRYTAQWNDDWHHAAHVLLTSESTGYYHDYADDPVGRLMRCLAEGFAYQGEPSPHRGGIRRGEPSAHLPPARFVGFLQNHDQVGNRALGERLGALAEPEALEVLTAMLLLAPHVPLLFMGEEYGERRPFPFFCDFHDDLADAVREGRRREFARFPAFADPAARERIPDPNAAATFEAAKLRRALAERPEGARTLELHRQLLALRRQHIVPLLDGLPQTSTERFGERGLTVRWDFPGATLTLVANLGGATVVPPALPVARPMFALPDAPEPGAPLPPWSAAWYLLDSTHEDA